MSFGWFVVQTYAGFEAQVKTSLEERIRRENMTEKFGEILVPHEEVVEMREGQKHRSRRKLFPGYVLVNMEMNDMTWHLIKNVPKVKGFIGGRQGAPNPVPEREMDALLNNIESGVQAPKPKVLFDVGEVVRVVEGPFKDFNAVVEEVDYDKSRLSVSVQIFGRSTSVELEFSQVEKG